MAFWSETGTEPKRAYRWRMQLAGMSGDYLWYAKKVKKPALTISEHGHKYLNHTFWYPGKIEWADVTITLVDPGAENDVASTIADLLQQSGYNVPGDPDVFSTLSKSKSVGSLGQVVIEQIDSNGGIIEKWTLNNAWIKEASWGELDYDGEDLTMVDLTIKYDWAQLSDGGDSMAGGGGPYFSTQ